MSKENESTFAVMPKLSELIFSSASKSVQSQIAAIKSSNLCISNRLASIARDAEFITAVADDFALPVVANERCGSWYIPPEIKAGSAYFKSTDGHFGQWNFSLRRLNLQILDLVGCHSGVIVVDSTRQGKHIPDALSKTIPIWCAVVNRLLFPDDTEWLPLTTLRDVVPPSEHAQIERKLDCFVERAKTIELDITDLRKKLSKPLKPMWIVRSLGLPSEGFDLSTMEELPYHPIFLCMASEYQQTKLDSAYVQGSGDDSEGWAHGLTPSLFWSNRLLLLVTPEDELEGLIQTLVSKEKAIGIPSKFTSVSKCGKISVGTVPHKPESLESDSLVVICAPSVDEALQRELGVRLLWLECREGKLGSRDLRTELSKLEPFVMRRGRRDKFVVCCQTGLDISIGVALALMCLYTDDNDSMSFEDSSKSIGKPLIRKKISRIMVAMPSGRPSRATLNAVNSYLMKQDAQ